MKTRYIIFVLTLLVAAIPAAGRETYSLKSGWRFFDGRQTSSDGARAVMLPHTWNPDAAAGNADYYRGTGNYLKEFDVPAAWSGKRVFLKGYGGNSVTTVFVNSRLAGEHRGGHTAFCFEITDLLRPDAQNFLRVVVNNSPSLDVLPTAGDMSVYGGLFRDVEIIVTGRNAIAPTDHASDGVYIKQRSVSRQRVEADAVVRLSGSGDVQVRMTVTSARGDTVAVGSGRTTLTRGAVATVAVPFTINDPRLWHGVKDPHLYSVHVALSSGGTVQDAVEVTTGFRRVEVDAARGFFLNGEPYPLRGVIVHQDRPLVGNAITARQVAEDMAMIKEMGANAVRVFGVVHHPEFYRLCDREGIVVWSDFPLVGPAYLADVAFVDTESFRANGMSQAADIVRQQFNHPSVAIWGIFSNMRMRDPTLLPFVRALNDFAKSEDAMRLTAASSNDDGDINFATDLICWDHHFGWREGHPSDINIWKRDFRARWGNLRSAVSYGAGASIDHQGPLGLRPDDDGVWHPEQWQTYLHETYYASLRDDAWLWAIFAGNMFDYGAAGREQGGLRGINNTGLVTFDRAHRKDAFYFYKANWNADDPFLHIADRRWDVRHDAVQSIKVFTNIGEAELLVNGISQGSLAPHHGMAIWEDVKLREGVNIIEVHGGGQSDTVRLEFRPSAERRTL